MLLSKLKICAGVLAIAFAVTAHAQYVQHNLVSNGNLYADNVDPNLVNPWGLAFSANGPFWVADNGPSVSTVYNSLGQPFPLGHPLVVSVLPNGSHPTGVVFNGGTGFLVKKGLVSKPATFIFVTEGGEISGWNPNVDATHAIVMSDEGNNGAIYKAAALQHNKLFVTNFGEGEVDVYNYQMREVGHFTDPHLPLGYAPFGIEGLGHGMVMVTFALKDGDDDLGGPGHGFVDIFTEGGFLVRHFAAQGALNSPWGIAVAPNNFGPASGKILIGNFGDGTINVYSTSGVFLGPLKDIHDTPIVIDGLWSIRFGNGGLGGDANKLYFTAGPNNESDGLFGSIAFAAP